MGLVTTKEMFQKAYEGGYAIGAFNVNNMEIVQGITEAAGELRSPVILQVSKGARAYANHTYLVKLVEAALMEHDIPMALHLDHGPDFETCKACIDGGFTSVMIDGSQYDFEKNVEITRQVVEYAHEKGVVVEGELGKLAGVEDDVKVDASDAMYTHPDEVQEFVEHLNSSQDRSRSCVLISWRRLAARSRISQSCFMGHPASLRNTLRLFRKMGENWQMLSESRKICCAAPPSLLSARSTSTPT